MSLCASTFLCGGLKTSLSKPTVQCTNLLFARHERVHTHTVLSFWDIQRSAAMRWTKCLRTRKSFVSRFRCSFSRKGPLCYQPLTVGLFLEHAPRQSEAMFDFYSETYFYNACFSIWVHKSSKQMVITRTCIISRIFRVGFDELRVGRRRRNKRHLYVMIWTHI